MGTAAICPLTIRNSDPYLPPSGCSYTYLNRKASQLEWFKLTEFASSLWIMSACRAFTKHEGKKLRDFDQEQIWSTELLPHISWGNNDLKWSNANILDSTTLLVLKQEGGDDTLDSPKTSSSQLSECDRLTDLSKLVRL
jgi:hypothetical protein